MAACGEQSNTDSAAGPRTVTVTETVEPDPAPAASDNTTSDSAEDRGDELAARVKTLSATGQVPSLIGQDIGDAQTDDTVSNYDWNVQTVKQISSQEPGTVIAQKPAEGTTLKAGRSITLTVAKKAPPKPKQWVSVISESGSGQKRTDEFTIPEGVKARVKYTFGGDFNDSLFLKTLDEGSDDFGDMLVNEIGPHSGVSRLYGKSGSYYLEVDAGSWTVDVQVFKRP